jgi:hypothetical protein
MTATPPLAAIFLGLRSNKVVLQSRQCPFSIRERQAERRRRAFIGVAAARADLRDRTTPSLPINSTMTRHFIPLPRSAVIIATISPPGLRRSHTRSWTRKGSWPLKIDQGGISTRITSSLTSTRGVTLPRPGCFHRCWGFSGVVPFSMLLGLMFGHHFRQQRSASGWLLHRTLQPAALQALYGSARLRAAANDVESRRRRIGARKK